MTDLPRLAPFQFLLPSDPGHLEKQRTVEDYRDSDYERSWFAVTSWEGIKTVTTNLGTILDNVLSHHKHNQPDRRVWMDRFLSKLFICFRFAKSREKRGVWKVKFGLD